ncbi:hypothetical protein [Actinomadura parmotrematis]|uniref:DNA-directed RNA polymerase specialized sigma24 family protein n=1 Tax=Actinomadura parmotrematis TaxID=2864039 RepID=A0ABS7FYA7_9ACTN|nr:hypothetical protein [Actinomadura parmotrematis]MBW8485419.1 hypothetical protein [Actinomadura parmotrematis]
MAYLVLPGGMEQSDRLAAAHWIVHRSRTRRSGDADRLYAELRDRVLRRAMRGPGRPGPRLGPWLRARPAAASGDDLELTGALGGLSAGARAAYVLHGVEGLPDDQVRARLAAIGVADAEVALAEAAALDEGTSPDERRALLARPALDPTIARLYGRAARPRRPAALVAAAAVLVGGGAVVAAGGLGAARSGAQAAFLGGRPEAVTEAPAGLWRRTTRLGLEAWNPRGDLAGDGGLAKEALRAWNGGERAVSYDGTGTAPPSGRPQLLYAGTVDGRRVALLHDDERVARYTALPGERGKRTLEVFPEGRILPGGASPLKLAPGRYLLPPWVTGVKAAPLGDGEARWADVPVRDGVTAPVGAAAGAGCWRGPVLELQQPEIAHGRPYTMADLGRLSAANLMYQPPPPAPVRRLGPHQIDGAPEAMPQGFALWGRLGCTPAGPAALDRAGRGDVESATAWEFWSGALPDKGGKGHWVCTRYAYDNGRSATYATLLDDRGAVLTGAHTDTWDCSRLQRDVVSGGWWRSPAGRWWYLAAASRRVTTLYADGPFERPAVKDGFLTARGPAGARPPSGRVLLTGGNYHGQLMPVFQARS